MCDNLVLLQYCPEIVISVSPKSLRHTLPSDPHRKPTTICSKNESTHEQKSTHHKKLPIRIVNGDRPSAVAVVADAVIEDVDEHCRRNYDNSLDEHLSSSTHKDAG